MKAWSGFLSSDSSGLVHDKSYVLRHAIGSLWDRHGTFDCDESWVDAIVEEFAEFVDRPAARFRFQAQLLNYRMTAARLDLPDNLTVRRLSEQEVSAFHGGPLEMLGFMSPQTFGIHEFVIEGEHEEVKVFGDLPAEAVAAPDKVKTRLDRAILCFRTFKTGHIGYDYVHFNPLKFCPIPLSSHGYGDLYVPFGSYHVSDEEVGSLGEYAALVFAMSEAAMEMACGRLADAEIRTRPHDRLVDAVIGMEALLLAALGKDDRKGELRYRFSLHYSLLFGSPEERYRAFRVAKDLYDLRSTIAHGGSLKDDEFRVGEERLKLADAAKRATEGLRTVIRRFLPQAKAAPYKKPDFWDRAYFGIADAGNN